MDASASIHVISRLRVVATMAEPELSAFFKAVTKLFGSEQAESSAEDWLIELSESDGLPSSIRE